MWIKRLALLLLTLLGFALRLPLLNRFPLREDEAIYGYWALHGWLVDPLFLDVWPDKPPLFLWLLGLAFHLFGHGQETAEAAARLAGIAASTLTIPLLAVTARRWWGDAAAVAAALLAALNPFAVSFGPTAFTDPLLVLAGSGALALAAHRRPFWAGLWLGVAIMTKQQGLLFVPLVVGVWAAGCWEGGRFRGPPPVSTGGYGMRKRWKLVGGRAAALFLAGLALVVIPVVYWDSLRWAVAPSPWVLGAANAGGVAPLPAGEWPGRSAAWAQLSWWLLASPLMWGVYTLAVLGAAVRAVRRRTPPAEWLPAALLASWAAGFLLLHSATNVQVWDRYLLPLTIPLALVGGWALFAFLEVTDAPAVRQQTNENGPPCPPDIPLRPPDIPPAAIFKGGGGSFWKTLLLAALLLAVVPPAWQAAGGHLPVGGDHGDYAGVHEALAAVNRPGSLLFHRELGWHARFALFDAVRSGDVQLRYYPSTVYLADAAAKSAHRQRFVIAPDWSPLPDLPLQLANRGLQAQIVLRAGHFTVYRIDERPAGGAAWRVCALPPVGPFALYGQTP